MENKTVEEQFQRAKDDYAVSEGFNNWNDLIFNSVNFAGIEVEIKPTIYYRDGFAKFYASLQCAELKKEVEKLQKFKDYVHDRLDKMGVPVDPESPHKAIGCRIGGRLDFIEQYREEISGIVSRQVEILKDRDRRCYQLHDWLIERDEKIKVLQAENESLKLEVERYKRLVDLHPERDVMRENESLKKLLEKVKNASMFLFGKAQYDGMALANEIEEALNPSEDQQP